MDHLKYMGAALDEEANARHGPVISSEESGIDVLVIPTDEEAMIARHTGSLI